jgi:hypothetical protein
VIVSLPKENPGQRVVAADQGEVRCSVAHHNRQALIYKGSWCWMAQKPHGYHNWDYDQRRQFDRQEQEKENLEFELRRHQENMEAAEWRTKRDLESLRYDRDCERERFHEISEELQAAEVEIDLLRRFLTSKGLLAEYDEWVIALEPE